MRIVYTAKRSLVSGHTAGNEYEIIIGMRVFDVSRKTYKTKKYALNRTVRSQLEAIKVNYAITTTKIGPTLMPNFEEFLDSVANDENFVIDPDSSTLGVDVSPKTVKLTDKNLRFRRIMRTAFFRLPFKCEDA